MGQGAWRLLSDPPGSAAWNMSVDEALLCAVEDQTPVLRFYSWCRPAISLGYRQATPTWPSGSRPGELVRRATGGGTVLHAGDLSYALAAPLGCSDLPHGMRPSYEWICQVLILGLRAAGVNAAPARAVAAGARAEICFAAASGSEIESGGAKLVGSAQRRTAWGFLQHGSIRISDDRALYQSMLGSSPGSAPKGLACSREDLRAALIGAFREALTGRLEPGGLSDNERALTSERHVARGLDSLVVPGLFSRRSAIFADRLP